MRGFTGEAVREYLEAASSQFTVGEYWDSLNYNGGVPDHNQVRRDLPPPLLPSGSLRLSQASWVQADGTAAGSKPAAAQHVGKS